MGRNKAWVRLAGASMIERVSARLQELCQEIIIVATDLTPYESLGLRLASDVWPGKGSLGGIYSGLLAARSEHVIAVACDMPFINVSLFRYMLSLANGYDVVIPSAPDPSKPQVPRGKLVTAKDRELHTLHAIYSKACLEPMAARLKADDLRMISFFPDVRVRVVEAAEVEQFDPEHLSLFNINTADDLQLAERLVSN